MAEAQTLSWNKPISRGRNSTRNGTHVGRQDMPCVLGVFALWLQLLLLLLLLLFWHLAASPLGFAGVHNQGTQEMQSRTWV